jgi:hypothetical protein
VSFAHLTVELHACLDCAKQMIEYSAEQRAGA